MSEKAEVAIIARMHSDFTGKFGIPRQSGIVGDIVSRIVFEKDYRSPEAIRGIEDFTHLWLIWIFSESHGAHGLTVRPPRLGGNERRGVFATRSPFRPSPVGISSVKLIGVDYSAPDSPVLIVSGADLLDKTPIIDIKPYLPYTDAHPDASSGFADTATAGRLEVVFHPEASQVLTTQRQSQLASLLAQDPRPSYIDDPVRVYGMSFAGFEISFTVKEGVLTVTGITESKTSSRAER